MAVHRHRSQSGVWSAPVEPGDLDHAAIKEALAASGARPLLVLELAKPPGTSSALDPVEAHRRSLPYIGSVFGAGRMG